MIKWLVDFSLRFRGVVITLGIVVLGYGIYIASRSQLDVFPEFAPPQVVIQTEAVGLSAEEVEQLVTLPLETQLNGTAELDTIRSSSIVGLSVITCVFQPNTDIFRARQLITEKLQLAASQLPSTAGPPQMMPIISNVGIILKISVTSDKT